MRIFMAILIFTLSLFSQNFKQDIQKLDGKDFKHNEELIVNLSKIYADDERLTLFLEKFLAGELYLSSDSRVFALLEKDANILHVQDVGDLSKSDVDMLHVQKVRVNNRLRALLRKSISKIKLTSKDRDLRLEASKNILQNLTQDDIEIINEVLQSEKDDKVIDVLQEAWAIGVVQFAPDEQKLEAVKKLGSLSSSNALWTLKELKTDDLQLQKERDKSISQIESIRGVYSFFQTLFFGLSQGSILLLASC